MTCSGTVAGKTTLSLISLSILLTVILSVSAEAQQFHTIYGYVYVAPDKPANEATVKLTNLRTGDSLSKTTDINGFYSFQLANFPSGWEDDEKLRIEVKGTGNYKGWESTVHITIDASLTVQKVKDIFLSFPLIVNFTFSPLHPLVNKTVMFTDNSTSSDEIISWHWDFGDGTNDTGKEVVHIYEKAGNYTVTLTVTDESMRTASFSQALQVAENVTKEEDKNKTPADSIFFIASAIILAIIFRKTTKRFK